MKTLITLLLLVSFGYSQRPIAIVLKAKGNVTLERDGKKDVVKRGTKVYNDDVLQTLKKSLVALRFLDDKSTVRIRQNSTFTVQGKKENNSTWKNIALEAGDILASVAKQKGEFRIESPTSVASVKGTRFGVSFSPVSGASTTYVFEGLVEIKSKKSGKTQNINPGQKAVVNNKGEVQSGDFTSGEFDETADDMDEALLEFQDQDGNKKYLKLKFIPKQESDQ